jgi:hypothetical protein
MNAAGFAAFFFYGVGAAKFEARAAHRFGSRQARSDVFLHLLVEVITQLIIEFDFHCVAPEQSAQPGAEIGKHGRAS